MRYPASEKLEIIRLVEQSHLPVRQTVEKLGIQPSRFYRWYDRLQTAETLAEYAGFVKGTQGYTDFVQEAVG